MCGEISGRACIFGIWMISTPRRWSGSTRPRIRGCMARPERFLLRGCEPRDYNQQTRAPRYDTSVLTTRRSSKDCFISSSGNLYSVPAAYARKTLQVKITEAEELVICSEVGHELARHRVLLGRQERSVQAEHYRGLGMPVPRIEQASAVQELRPADRTLFWDAPVVEVRSLSVYDQVLQEVL